MKIKKVDDKPMVIHTKEKPKIHSHEPKKAAVKGSNVYTVDRSPKIKGAEAEKKQEIRNEAAKYARKSDRKTYRKSTVHQSADTREGRIAKYRRNVKEANKSIKVKNTTLRNAGMIGAKTMTDQMDGGAEVQQSAMIMYEASKPVTGTASRGAELFKRQVLEEKKRRIKKVEAGKRIAKKGAKKAAKDTAKTTAKTVAKKTAKETAKVSAKAATKVAASAAGTAVAPGVGTAIGYAAGEVVGAKIEHGDMVRDNRARKIKFFLDKMKAEENQTDSVAKMVKDLVFRRAGLVAKQIALVVLPFLLVMVLLISMIAVPVVAVVGVAYNSPFAIFLPPLEEGDTVMTVASSYAAAFNEEVSTLANEHSGCDEGRIVYVNYEGTDAAPTNYYDILAVYMVKYGIGDTATIMNDTSKEWLKTVVEDMCSYITSTETETETVTDEDGSTSTVSTTYLNVNVTLKTWRDMVAEYGFGSDEQEMLTEFMRPDYLALLGYSPGGGGGNMQSALSPEEINEILSGISDSTQRAACSYALYRVGYPYSQDLRDSGEYYACSSLAYYSWQAAGMNIAYGGATTASAEGQGLNEAGKTVDFAGMQPGDLIFYSTSQNGRYMNITHVAVYVGNGKVVEALNENYGVVYQDMRTANIVLICRPS